jgi:sarcosine oxidase delta subunit
MPQAIAIECPRCQQRWSIDYATLQRYKVLYKGLADKEPATRSEEYTIPCPRCGETSVQLFTIKAGDASHE